MPLILEESLDPTNSLQVRREAANLLFAEGRVKVYRPSLSVEKRQENQKIAETNRLLSLQRVLENEDPAKLEEKIQSLKNWFEQEVRSKHLCGMVGKRLNSSFLKPVSPVI